MLMKAAILSVPVHVCLLTYQQMETIFLLLNLGWSCNLTCTMEISGNDVLGLPIICLKRITTSTPLSWSSAIWRLGSPD